MAKTLSDELLGLLDADTQTKVRAALASKPDLIARDMKAAEVLSLYYGEDDSSGATTTTTTSTAHTPTLPSAAATTAAGTTTVAAGSTTTAPGAADGLAAVLAKLDGLKSDLDTRFKNVVTMDKLPEYRKELLTLAIQSNAQYDDVREIHREEFGERLPFDQFKAFVELPENFIDGKSKFPSMKVAHDVFVAEKRKAKQEADVQKRINDGIEEAKKQMRSGATVPGQTQQTAMSPAQQVMAKARAGVTGGADSAALKAARQMEELDHARTPVN